MCVSAYVHMYDYTCTQMYTPTKGIYYYRLYRSYKYQSCLYCTNVCSCCYFRGSITSSCLCYMWLFFSVMSYRELAGWTALLPLLGPHHKAIWDQYTQQDPYIVFLNGWAFMWREWFVLIVYWTSVESNLQLQINNTPKTHSVPTLCLLPYEMPWKPTKIESSDPGIRLTSMNSRNQLNILIPDFN